MSVSSGWGRFTWGQANWNENQKFGERWGAKTWNEQSWGDLNDVTISLTGFEISSSMGIDGWGNNTYGQGSWGEFAIEQTGRRRRDDYTDGTVRFKIESSSP